MRMPNENTAPRRLYTTHGLYLQARLAAHPGTRLVHETWISLQQALRQANLGLETAWEKRVIARTTLEYADFAWGRVEPLQTPRLRPPTAASAPGLIPSCKSRRPADFSRES